MQLLLAYALDRAGDGDLARRLSRVEDHYRPLWQTPTVHHRDAAGRLGLHIWDGAETPWIWPAFDRDAQLSVATTYLPLGYERVVGDISAHSAALPLARALAQRAEAILELTAPFVIATLDRDAEVLSLRTDAVGMGRLYEMRFPGGWVWTNRPAAAALFAGTRPELDRDGWRGFATTGVFFGQRTPIAGLSAVSGASVVGYDMRADRRISESIDSLAIWSTAFEQDTLSKRQVQGVADGLTGLVLSLGKVTSADLSVDLSGGRDSRVVAAAAIVAGLPLTVVTNAAEAGEGDTAEALIAALPPSAKKLIDHVVRRPEAGEKGRHDALPMDAPMLGNARAWHLVQDGLRPSTFLGTKAPDSLIGATGPTMGGVGGEVAHGHYYPDHFETLAKLPSGGLLDVAVKLVLDKLANKVGPSAQSKATATADIRRTIDGAIASGLSDAKVLDRFYATEVVRRWGTGADRTGNVMPLLTPEFFGTALGLSTAQRRANALHRSVTELLVPEWAGIGYYQRPDGVVPPALVPRIASAPDAELIDEMIGDEERWADAFDRASIQGLWAKLRSGQGTFRNERMIQRLLWMATYADHLDELYGDPPRQRTVAETPTAEAGLGAPTERSLATKPPRSAPLRRSRQKLAGALRRSAKIIAPK